MADDSDSVQITFTAQIESLQEGIQMGEDLIKEFASEIQTLQDRINSLSEVGGDWAAYQAMRAMQTELDTVSSKTDILKSKLATLSVQQFQPASIQFAIDEVNRLNEAQSSARASAAVFSQTLGNLGVSATELAIQEREATLATDQLNRATGSFYASQAAGRASVAANLAALQGQNVAYQGATASANGYAQAAGRINATTSMFRLASQEAQNLRVNLSMVTREIIVLAHEAVSGRFSRIPGSLMVMGEALGGLSLPLLGLVGAFAAVTAAIAYFTYRAMELSATVKEIQIGTTFAGNAEITNAALESTIVELGRMHTMTRATAEEVVGQWARMANMTVPMMKTMSEAAREYGQATGTSAKEATTKLAAAMDDENISFKKLREMFPGATAEQLAYAESSMRSGNENQRQATIMGLLNTSLAKTRDEQIEADTAWARNIDTVTKWVPLGILATAIHWNLARATANATKAVDEETAALKKNAEEQAKKPLTREQRISAAELAGSEAAPNMNQLETANKRIADIKDGIAALHGQGGVVRPQDAAEVAHLNAELKEAEAGLAELTHKQGKKLDFSTNLAGQEEIRATKETNAAISADIKLSSEQQHDLITANWQKLLDEGKLTSDQRKEVETEMWRSTAAAAKAGSAETVAQARNSIAAINADEKKGAAEKLADIVAVWAKVKDNDKLGYQQRLEASTEYYKAEAAAAKQAHSVAVDAAKSDAATAIQISHLKIQEERDDLTTSFKLHQVSAAERTKLLQDLAEREEQIDEQSLQEEMRIIGEGNAGYQEAYNRILVLREQLKAEKSRIAREEAAEDMQNARQSVTNWRAAVNEITSAENQMITGIIGGRETATQILGKMIDSFVEKELEADMRYLTMHLLLSEKELAADKAADESGLLWKTLFETQKTAVTTTGEAARTGATIAGTATRAGVQATENATENASFMVRVARWVASELGMTSATTAGATERAAAQTAAAASQSAALAQNAMEAESYAALSAVEAAASVAAIPFVGWSMAPGVAAEQYAAMQPFVTAAALATGAWEVPHDMPAYIHKGESVVPKNFAEGLRSSGSLAGTTVTAKGGNTTHFTYAPTINAPAAKTLSQHLASDASDMYAFINEGMRDGKIGS